MDSQSEQMRSDYAEPFPDDGPHAQEEPERSNRTAGLGAWALSIAGHILVLLVLALVVIISLDEKDRVPVRAATIPPPADQPDPPPEREVMQTVTEVVVQSETVIDNPVVTDLDLPVEEVMTEDDVVAEVAEAKGRSEAVANSEMGGVGAFMAIGAGGGSAGAFGNRSGGGRARAVGRFGGSRASENAVEAALRWFARHQSPNGQWDLNSYQNNCTLAGPKCEPGNLSG